MVDPPCLTVMSSFFDALIRSLQEHPAAIAMSIDFDSAGLQPQEDEDEDDQEDYARQQEVNDLRDYRDDLCGNTPLRSHGVVTPIRARCCWYRPRPSKQSLYLL